MRQAILDQSGVSFVQAPISGCEVLVDAKAVSACLYLAAFADGADVKAGEVLFTIDARPFQACLEDRHTAARIRQDIAEARSIGEHLDGCVIGHESMLARSSARAAKRLFADSPSCPIRTPASMSRAVPQPKRLEAPSLPS